MRNTYRRARTDYTAGVVAIYDNGGKTADRYTVVYTPYPYPHGDYPNTYVGKPVFGYVCMSGAPFHPQGVCQHGESIGRRPTGGWDGCRKVIRFEDLPADCQEVVRMDLKDQT
jgi:hypothetical protein